MPKIGPVVIFPKKSGIGNSGCISTLNSLDPWILGTGQAQESGSQGVIRESWRYEQHNLSDIMG